MAKEVNVDGFSFCKQHTWDSSCTICIVCGFNLIDKDFYYTDENNTLVFDDEIQGLAHEINNRLWRKL